LIAALLLLLLTTTPAIAGQGERRAPQPAPSVDPDSPFAPFAAAADPVDGAVFALHAGGEPIALGTVIDADGLLITKASELPEDQPVVLMTRRGRPLATTLVATDPATDLALLRAPLTDAPAVDFAAGNEDADNPPAIGQWIITAGPAKMPLGVGIVSVQPRSIAPRRVLLGVEIRPDKRGPRVQRVIPDMGADRAGIKRGDIITHVNDRPTSTRADVIRFLKDRVDGDEVTVKITRGDEKLTFTIGVQPLPQTLETRGQRMNRMGGELSARSHGFERVIQHDAVLAPHQVGGPAVDLEGNVLGLNIARAGRIASYALPRDLVAQAIDRLRAKADAPAVD